MQGANPCTPRTTEMATSEPPNSEIFQHHILLKAIITKYMILHQAVITSTVHCTCFFNENKNQDGEYAFKIKITNQDGEYALKIRIKNQDGEYA